MLILSHNGIRPDLVPVPNFVRSPSLAFPEHFTDEGDFMAQVLYICRKPGRFVIERKRYSQETTIEKVQVNKSEPRKKELKTFIRAVWDEKKFPVTPKQALNNLILCEQVHTGMCRNEQVQWPESISPAVADKSISPILVFPGRDRPNNSSRIDERAEYGEGIYQIPEESILLLNIQKQCDH